MGKSKRVEPEMDIDKDRVLDLVKNLKFEEAISHRVHSRVFEILGYLSILDTSNVSYEIRTGLDSIEELSKKLVDEIHLIIDYYTTGKE